MKNNKKLSGKKQIEIVIDRLEKCNIDYIQYFDNMISANTCKKYVKKFNEIYKNGLCREGETIKGLNKVKKISFDYPMSNKDKDSELTDIYNNIHEILGYCLYSYLLNVGQLGLIYTGLNIYNLKDNVPFEDTPDMPTDIGLETMWFRKYPKNSGGYFLPHCDNESYPGEGRMLAAIIYLNDIKHGGETVFPLLKRSIKPKAGRILIFPSYFTHLHYGKNALSDRYIFACHIDKFIENNKNKEKE